MISRERNAYARVITRPPVKNYVHQQAHHTSSPPWIEDRSPRRRRIYSPRPPRPLKEELINNCHAHVVTNLFVTTWAEFINNCRAHPRSDELWSLRNKCNHSRGRPACLPRFRGSAASGQTRRSAPTLDSLVALFTQRPLFVTTAHVVTNKFVTT